MLAIAHNIIFMQDNQFEEGNFSKSKLAKGMNACMVCGESAEFCMRGLPKNTYCRQCAEAYFEMLEYLDRLGR